MQIHKNEQKCRHCRCLGTLSVISFVSVLCKTEHPKLSPRCSPQAFVFYLYQGLQNSTLHLPHQSRSPQIPQTVLQGDSQHWVQRSAPHIKVQTLPPYISFCYLISYVPLQRQISAVTSVGRKALFQPTVTYRKSTTKGSQGGKPQSRN